MINNSASANPAYRAALFDADGVVIEPRRKFFSQRLIDNYHISEVQATTFVRDVIVPSMTDQVDLRQVLPRYLEAWHLPISVDGLLAYWWSSESTVNNSVLRQVDELRSKGVRTYLASDQERYRAAYLMNDLALNSHFDGSFFSYALQHTKHEPVFWESVIQTLDLPAGAILYWDDDPKNVEVAANMGIIAQVYPDAPIRQPDGELSA